MSLIFTTDVTETITVTSAHDGMIFAGGVNLPRVINWRGPRNKPVFHIKGCRDITFRDFTVKGHQGASAAFVSESTKKRVVTNNLWDNIHITQVVDGFVFQGRNANNSECQFHRVDVRHFTHHAWSFRHTQSKAHGFYGCNINCQNKPGSVGISTNNGPQAVGGSFCWYGGNCNGVETVFELGSPNDPIGVYGLISERCERLLTATGPTSAGWPVILSAVRFATNRLAADKEIVQWKWNSALQLSSCAFTGRKKYILLSHNSNKGCEILMLGTQLGKHGKHIHVG